jgi:hypothetical protein
MRLMCPQPRDWNDPTTGLINFCFELSKPGFRSIQHSQPLTGDHISFDNTGNKFGPCGPFSDQQYWGKGGVTELQPNSWVVCHDGIWQWTFSK